MDLCPYLISWLLQTNNLADCWYRDQQCCFWNNIQHKTGHPWAKSQITPVMPYSIFKWKYQTNSTWAGVFFLAALSWTSSAHLGLPAFSADEPSGRRAVRWRSLSHGYPLTGGQRNHVGGSELHLPIRCATPTQTPPLSLPPTANPYSSTSAWAPCSGLSR